MPLDINCVENCKKNMHGKEAGSLVGTRIATREIFNNLVLLQMGFGVYCDQSVNVHSKNYSAKIKSIGVKFSAIKDFPTGQHQKCYFSSS